MTLPTVWTNDDIHAGQAEALRRQLALLDRYAIPGVFFVIPDNGGLKPLDHDTELLRVIEAARNRGHEFYQHGFHHTAFECGIPALEMLALDPKATSRFESERAEIEAGHTLERQVEMLENGQRIWRRAFGENSPGFRPGWGAFCTNFYRALAALGYQWVSSRIPSMTAYHQRVGTPITFHPGVPTGPHQLPGGVWEFPIGAEVGWRVPNDPAIIEGMVALGLEHHRHLTRLGDPHLLLSHPHGLAFEGALDGRPPLASGTGYAVHEKLLPLLIKGGEAEFIGMKELLARTVAKS